MKDSYDPEYDVSNDVKIFIITVRRLARNDMEYKEATPASQKALLALLNEKVAEKKEFASMRKPILQAITGLPMVSQKYIKQHYVNVLISEVKRINEQFPNTIIHIERVVKKWVDVPAWELFPWEAPSEANMSVLPAIDPTLAGGGTP